MSALKFVRKDWNCPYCVITVASHRSNCEGGGWGDELNLKVPGTLPAELSWSGQLGSITEDFRIWRCQVRKQEQGTHFRKSG